ncbi:MAG: hypothetical protein XU13_C0041G0031 [Candidatus Rokubacteria bacterium CSP1-6]|nr:MAG: hypothetical protein XU13_C0041G0031 [Candidatus Rokubacteria bacterium CSP1-6]
MKRWIAVAAFIGLLVGLLPGYLWWGVRTQRQLNEVQGQVLAVQSDLKAAQDKAKALEAELRQERDRRQRLEEIVTKGRK